MDVMHHHTNDFGTGISYSITVDPATKDFTLELPDQLTVRDNLDLALTDRSLLYFFLHPEMVDWMQEIKVKIDKEREFISNDVSVLWINGLCYEVKTEKTGYVQVTLPEQIRTFHVDSIYFDNPDFPLIQDSLFDTKLRECLRKHGFYLPEVPYKAGINMIKK